MLIPTNQKQPNIGCMTIKYSQSINDLPKYSNYKKIRDYLLEEKSLNVKVQMLMGVEQEFHSA